MSYNKLVCLINLQTTPHNNEHLYMNTMLVAVYYIKGENSICWRFALC